MAMKFKLNLLLLLIFCIYIPVLAQNKEVILPANWYNLDLAKDGYFGIGTEKAYSELLKNKTAKQKVIVAVIDGGVDINHEDLKGAIWTNSKEIPGNGIDDDRNGYIDDVHGWNFIGSKKGNLVYDNLELVRIYRKYKPKYASTIRSTVLDSAEKIEFALYTRATAEFGKKYDEADQNYRYLFAINKVLDSVAAVNHKTVPALLDIENYKADDEMEENVKRIVRSGSKRSGSFEKFYKEMKDAFKAYDIMVKYNLNPKYDERANLVGDNYSDSKERFYGNSDVTGPSADHGTHVSGIIAANRNNAIGINGISNDVSIMAIRVVPVGDERDKDVANGIRYAADNGARIINMSFGKNYKWDKPAVDQAIKYAEKKGVLIVHAAGNEDANNDVEENYPTKYFDSPELASFNKVIEKTKHTDISFMPVSLQGSRGRVANAKVDLKAIRINDLKRADSLRTFIPSARNWIEVGASSYKDDNDLKTSFSNYGKFNVDVFAPGFKIKSTIAGSKYDEYDGTSMAAPVVSGLAALILAYYPQLTAVQLKDIILKSVVKVTHKVKFKNDLNQSLSIPFTDVCVSGGVVNVYNALVLANTYTISK
jgi:cell wall-associated protease